MKFYSTIIFLLLGLTLNGQVRLKNIERHSSKWQVPVTSYLLPLQSEYSMSFLPISTILDSSGISTAPDSIYFSSGMVHLRDGSGGALIPVPSLTDTISGHKIGVFNVGDGSPGKNIRETITSFSPISSGVRTYTNENGTTYDLDASSTNELQNLSLLDSINGVFRLQISDGNIVKWKDSQGFTDTMLIRSIVSDSLNAIIFPDDSTTVSDTPLLDLTMTGTNITGTVDTVTYLSTKYGLSLKEDPLSFTGPLNRSVNTISIPEANGSTNGYLSSTKYNDFNNKANLPTVYTTAGKVTSSTTLDSVAFGAIWLEPNKTYKIDIYGSYTSSSLTTGIDLSVQYVNTTSIIRSGYLSALRGANAATEIKTSIDDVLSTVAVNNITTEYYVGGSFITKCTTASGNYRIKIMFASEIAASSVELTSDTVVVVQKLD